MIYLSSLTKDYYKSGEVASFLNVTTRTVQGYCINGLMEEKIINNRRYIPKESVIQFLDVKGLLYKDSSVRKDVIYARVSTHKQKERGDLERQVDTLKEYVLFKNPINLEIITDVGSGLNDNRKGLIKLLKDVESNEISRIFIAYKDRLTRFGFNYLALICDCHNTEIVIVSNDINDKSLSEELAEDIISIIHSFSGKLYGMRRNVKERICEELSCDESGRNSSSEENG